MAPILLLSMPTYTRSTSGLIYFLLSSGVASVQNFGVFEQCGRFFQRRKSQRTCQSQLGINISRPYRLPLAGNPSLFPVFCRRTPRLLVTATPPRDKLAITSRCTYHRFWEAGLLRVARQSKHLMTEFFIWEAFAAAATLPLRRGRQ